MQIVDLFSGIGGFSLAGKWMGWETIQFCEWNEFAQNVLKYHFPNVPIHGDIKTLNYAEVNRRIDRSKPVIITAGFPCQPFSTAGKRRGKEDERYGWPDCIEAVRSLAPDYCVFENVRGLINWNGGLVFDEVQADLEDEGYEVQPFLLPAAGVNAPHRRDRIWFVAYSGLQRQEKRQKQSMGPIELCEEQDASDSDSKRLKECYDAGFTEGQERQFDKAFPPPEDWQNFPTQSPVRNGDDGLSSGLSGITFPKWRNESIKAGGNAVVPQVVYQIFKAIEQYETLNRG